MDYTNIVDVFYLYRMFCIKYMILMLKSSTSVSICIAFKLECSPGHLFYKPALLVYTKVCETWCQYKILYKKLKHRQPKEYHSFFVLFFHGFTTA